MNSEEQIKEIKIDKEVKNQNDNEDPDTNDIEDQEMNENKVKYYEEREFDE